MNVEEYFNSDLFNGQYNGMDIIDMTDTGRQYDVVLMDESGDRYEFFIPKYENVELFEVVA